MGVQHQLGVLADDDEDTQAEREQRTEGEPFGAVGEGFERFALRDVGAAEAVVADGDAEPGDEAGQPRSGEDVFVHMLADAVIQLQQEDSEDDEGSGKNGVVRHAAAAASAGEKRPGEAVFAHGVEHPR